MAGSSLAWTVHLQHDDHRHPFSGPVSGTQITLTYPAPEDLAAAEGSYLHVELVATDSRGLSTTVNRSLLPAKVTVSLASSPTGARLGVNGRSVTAPSTVTSWRGYLLNLSAPGPVDGRRPVRVALVVGRWRPGPRRDDARVGDHLYRDVRPTLTAADPVCRGRAHRHAGSRGVLRPGDLSP